MENQRNPQFENINNALPSAEQIDFNPPQAWYDSPDIPDFTPGLDPEYVKLLDHYQPIIEQYTVPFTDDIKSVYPSENNDTNLSDDPYKNNFDRIFSAPIPKSDQVSIADPLVFSAKKTQFDRFYSHRNFSKLGFHPYANNEEYYNDNSTVFSDTVRMLTQFYKLAGSAIRGNYRSFGDMFDNDPYTMPDVKTSDEFEKAMGIGMSSRGGITGFASNLFLNFGYTYGIILSVAVEELALAAITAATGFTAAPAAAARTGLNATKVVRAVGKSIGNTFVLGRMAKATRQLSQTLNKTDNARTFWQATKSGEWGVLGTLFLPETMAAVKKLQTAKTAGKSLSGIAKMSTMFGGFYREIRAINYAMSESKLESGFVLQQQIANGIAIEEQKKLQGLEPNLALVGENANKAAFATTMMNFGLIYMSNKLVLDTAFKGFNKTLTRNLNNSISGTAGRAIRQSNIVGPDGKLLRDIYSDAGKGVKGRINKLKAAGAKGIGYATINSSLRYFAANLAEGVQELGQEAISHGTKYYFSKLQENPLGGGADLYKASINEAIGSQASGQGIETFLSGFLMGGLAKGPQKLIFEVLPDLKNRIFDKEAYKEYQERREAEVKKIVEERNKNYNEFIDDPVAYLDKHINNFLIQNEVNSEMNEASYDGDMFKFIDAKDFAKFHHIYGLMESGSVDLFRTELQDFLNLTDEELNEAFPTFKEEIKQGKLRERANDLINLIDKAEKAYNENKDALVNPYDPNKYDKNTEEYKNELTKYASFEHIRYLQMFTQDSFNRALERADKIYNELASDPILKKIQANDLTVLLDENSIKSEINLLKIEIENLDDSEEGKKLKQEKQTKIEKLKKVSEVLNLKDNLKQDGSFDKRKVKRILEPLKEYIQFLADTRGDFVDVNRIKEVLKKITDHRALSERAKANNRALQYLAVPENFDRVLERQTAIYKSLFEKNKENVEARIKKYIGTIEKNNLLNGLADLGVYPDANEVEGFLFFNDTRILKTFYHKDGTVTKDSGPVYKKIQNLIDVYNGISEEATQEEANQEEETDDAAKPPTRNKKVTQKEEGDDEILDYDFDIQLDKLSDTYHPVLKETLYRVYKESMNIASKAEQNTQTLSEWQKTDLALNIIDTYKFLKTKWKETLSKNKTDKSVIQDNFIKDIGLKDWLSFDTTKEDPDILNKNKENNTNILLYLDTPEVSYEEADVLKVLIKHKSDNYIVRILKTFVNGGYITNYKIITKTGLELSDQLLSDSTIFNKNGAIFSSLEDAKKAVEKLENKYHSNDLPVDFQYGGVTLFQGAYIFSGEEKFQVLSTPEKIKVTNTLEIVSEDGTIITINSPEEFKKNYSIDKLTPTIKSDKVSRIRINDPIRYIPYENEGEDRASAIQRLDYIFSNLTPEQRKGLELVVSDNPKSGTVTEREFTFTDKEPNSQLSRVSDKYSIGIRISDLELRNQIDRDLKKAGLNVSDSSEGIIAYLPNKNFIIYDNEGNVIDPRNIDLFTARNIFYKYNEEIDNADLEKIKENFAIQANLIRLVESKKSLSSLRNQKADIEKRRQEELDKVKPVFHHTKVKPEDFNFESFQKEKGQQISQFGNGLNVASVTNSFFVNRYGQPIEGEINDSDFVVIDANMTEAELYDYLISLGYKINTPQNPSGKYTAKTAKEEYNGTDQAKDAPYVFHLFNDFQQSNPEVKGVKVINHIISNTNAAPFYVIYDAKSFYGEGSLKKQINAKYDAELAALEDTTKETKTEGPLIITPEELENAGFYFNMTNRFKENERESISPNALYYNTIDGKNIVIYDNRKQFTVNEKGERVFTRRDKTLSTIKFENGVNPASRHREIKDELGEKLYKTARNKGAYVLVVKNQGGEYTLVELKPSKLDRDEFVSFVDALIKQSEKTVNENLIEDTKKTAEKQDLRNLAYNVKFNDEQIDSKIYIISKPNTIISLELDPRGRIEIQFLKYDNKTKKYEKQLKNKYNQNSAERIGFNEIIEAQEKIKDGEDKYNVYFDMFQEHFNNVNKRLKELGINVNITVDDIRKNISNEATVEEILNNTETNHSREVRKEYQITISQNDVDIQATKDIPLIVEAEKKKRDLIEKEKPEVKIDEKISEEEVEDLDELLGNSAEKIININNEIINILNEGAILTDIELAFYDNKRKIIEQFFYEKFEDVPGFSKEYVDKLSKEVDLISEQYREEKEILKSYVQRIENIFDENATENQTNNINDIKNEFYNQIKLIENKYKTEELKKDEDIQETPTIKESGITVNEYLDKDTLSDRISELESIIRKKQEELFEQAVLKGDRSIVDNDEELNNLKRDLNVLMSQITGNKILKGVVLDEIDVENINVFLDWAAKNLPDYIDIKDLAVLGNNMKSGGVRVGAFALALSDIAGGMRVRGTLYTGAETPFRYHEAFHAVFRLLLTDEQQNKYLRLAAKEVRAKLRKEGISFEKALNDFKNLTSEYQDLSRSDLVKLYYEEYLADQFELFKQSPKSTKTDPANKSFFARLIEWIKAFFSRFTKNELRRLYENIDSGKFKSSTPVINRFTLAAEQGITVEANAIMIPYEVIDAKRNLYKTLDTDAANAMIRSIAATYLQREEAFRISKANYRDDDFEEKTRNEILDEVIKDYKELYDFTKPFNKELSFELKLILNDFYAAFVRFDDEIKKAVTTYLSLVDVKIDDSIYVYEEQEDDEGLRTVNDWDKDASNYGGWNSISSMLRKFIMTTTVEESDMFNHEELKEGERLIVPVDFAYAYNGILKATANTTNPTEILNKLLLFGEHNPHTRAVVNRIFNRLGIAEEDITNGDWSSKTKDPFFLNALLSGLENFRVDYLFIHRNNDGEIYIYSASQRDDANAQIDTWGQAYINIYKKYNDKVKDVDGVLLKDKAKEFLEDFEAYISGNSIESISDIELAEIAKELREDLMKYTGIILSSQYIAYMILQNIEIKTQKQATLLEAYTNVESLTSTNIQYMKTAIDNDISIFSTGDLGSGRILKKISMANAEFDETIGASVFKNPNGDLVYAHQKSSFHLKTMLLLNNEDKLNELKKDEFLTRNWLLNNEAFYELARNKGLHITRVSGFKQGRISQTEDGIEESGGVGKTYGDLTPREFLNVIINSYPGLFNKYTGKLSNTVIVENENNEKEEVALAPVLIRVLEASNTGDLTYLPVIKTVEYNKEGMPVLTEKALQGFINNIISEFERIKKNVNPNTRDQRDIENYNKGKKRAQVFGKNRYILTPVKEKKNVITKESNLKTSEKQLINLIRGDQRILIYDNKTASKVLKYTTAKEERDVIISSADKKSKTKPLETKIVGLGRVAIVKPSTFLYYVNLFGNSVVTEENKEKLTGSTVYEIKFGNITRYTHSKAIADFLQGNPMYVYMTKDEYAKQEQDIVTDLQESNITDENYETYQKIIEILKKVYPNIELNILEKPEFFKAGKNVYNQLFSDTRRSKFDRQLADKLITFIEGLNIKVVENDNDLLDSLKFKTGTPLAAFDTLQKYLSLSSKITNKELTLQTANIIYTFLGKKSVIGVELWKSINNWEGYKKIYDKYDTYNDDELISENIEYSKEGFNPFAHKQAIIHFIAEMLEFGHENNYIGEKRINPDLTKDYFEAKGFKNKYAENPLVRAFNKLLNWINQNILGVSAVNEYNSEELKNLVLDIVDDVYKQDYTKFLRSYKKDKNGNIVNEKGEVFEQKFYQETLNKDPFAKAILEKLFENPFINYKLSGSQVIRRYGTLYRSVNEDLHDLDGVISLETFRQEPTAVPFYTWLSTRGMELSAKRDNKTFMKEVTPLLERMTWYQNVKQMFPDFVLDVVFIGKDHKNAESLTITGHVTHPTEIDPETGLNKQYVLDFFLRTNEGNYPEVFDNYYKDWKQIFEAKINMGRAKDIADLIYFEPFLEDKYKFTNKGFRYFSFAEDNAPQTFNQKNEGRIIGQAIIEDVDSMKGKILIDLVNQRIDTIPHEYAHFFIAKFRNSAIVKEAIKKWGSEEALVQSIGEQAVKQEGEAWGWWKSFVEWIKKQFSKLSDLDKQELTNILTDAFLTGTDISEYEKLFADSKYKPEPPKKNQPIFNSLPGRSSTPTMTYAGIGSRSTDPKVKDTMTKVAKYLEELGYTLNTGVTFKGKEEGADAAFSRGAKKKNLFSPENQGNREKEQDIAKEIHPSPKNLKPGALKLMARNTNQVFGDNLDTPVDFVIFWAKETDNPLRPKGGTGQAVEMARRKGIPTINMDSPNWRKELTSILKDNKLRKAQKQNSNQTYPIKEGVTEQYYEGNITPEPNTVFVFGSNPIGVNGNPSRGTGGAALVASTQFGVKQGEKMDNKLSDSGSAYGLTTVTGPGKKKSVSPAQITANVKQMYETARANPDKTFKVAYRHVGSEKSLNGYSGDELIDMFNKAGTIPSNVIFSKEWFDTGKLNLPQTEEYVSFEDYAGIDQDVEDTQETEIASDPKMLKDWATEIENIIAENNDLSFEEAIEQLGGMEEFKAFLINRLEKEFEKFLNEMSQISADTLLGSYIKEGLKNADGKKTSQVDLSNSLLNLTDDFTYNLKQIFFNDWLNTSALNQILLGDRALILKDSTDEIKRAKGSNAAGDTAATAAIAEEFGIMHETKHISMFGFQDPENTKSYGEGSNVQIADGQTYGTIKAFKHFWFGLGKTTPKQLRLLQRIENGEEIPYEELLESAEGGQSYAKMQAMMNSKKFVYDDGKIYLKTSIFFLTKEYTSYEEDGIWKPKPNKIALHNLRVSMEKFEEREWAEGRGTLALAAPASALKKLKMNIQTFEDATSGREYSTDNRMDMDAEYMRLQTINPSNKIEITDPNQVRTIITSEQNPDTEVIINGKTFTIAQIRNVYNEALTNRDRLNYTNKRNLIFRFDLEKANELLDKSKKANSLLPELYSFLMYAAAGLEASNATSNIIEMFSVDENGQQKYNLNNPQTVLKFEQLFLSFFTKGVMASKIPGVSAALVSDMGVRVYRKVYSVDKNGMPDEQEIIREDVFHRMYDANAIEYNIDNGPIAGDDKNLSGLAEAVKKGPVIIIDRLRDNMKEYVKVEKDKYKYTGQRYSEMIMAPHEINMAKMFARTNQKMPDFLSKMFTVRIPSQDKHSFMNVKWVDFMPGYYGSSVVVARELIEISGADFDIDKLYMHMKAYFYENGQFYEYGNVNDNKEGYEHYIKSVSKNVKKQGSVYGAAVDKFNKKNPSGLTNNVLKYIDDKNISENVAKAIIQLGLPLTYEDYVSYKNKYDEEPYTEAINNKILDYKFALLGNEHITNTKGRDVAIQHEPADTKPLTDLLDELSKTIPYFENLNSEEDVDIDNLMNKMKAFEANKAGANSIGAAVLPNLYLSLLKEYKISLPVIRDEQSGELLTKNLVFDEILYEDFDGEYAGDDGKGVPYRKQYLISALITAMTDNAKLRLSAKLGLNKDALAVVANMVALGVPLKTSILLINNPLIQQLYFKAINKETPTDPGIKKLTEIELGSLPGLFDKAKGKKEIPLLISVNDELLEYLITNEVNSEKLEEMDPYLISATYSVLEQFYTALQIKNYTGHLGSVLNHTKGPGKRYTDVLRKEKDAEALGLNLTNSEYKKYFDSRIRKGEVVINIRPILKNTWQGNLHNIFVEIKDKLLPRVFLTRTEVFMNMYNKFIRNIDLRQVSDEELEKFRLDLLSYITIKAYMQNLELSGSSMIGSLSNSILYPQLEGKKVTDLVSSLRERDPNNFFLKYFVIASEAQDENNNYGINVAMANTFVKLNDSAKIKIQSDLVKLYTNPYTRDSVIELIHYIMVKDGMSYNYGSLLDAVTPFIYERYLEQIDGIETAFLNPTETNMLNTFGTDEESLFQDFIIGYLKSNKLRFKLKNFRAGLVTIKSDINSVREFTLKDVQENPDTLFIYADKNLISKFGIMKNALRIPYKNKDGKLVTDDQLSQFKESFYSFISGKSKKEFKNYKKIVYLDNLIPEYKKIKEKSPKIAQAMSDILKQVKIDLDTNLGSKYIYIRDSISNSKLIIDLYPEKNTEVGSIKGYGSERKGLKLKGEKLKDKNKRINKSLIKSNIRNNNLEFVTYGNKTIGEVFEMEIPYVLKVGDSITESYRHFRLVSYSTSKTANDVNEDFITANYAEYEEFQPEGAFSQWAGGFMFGERISGKEIKAFIESKNGKEYLDPNEPDFNIDDIESMIDSIPQEIIDQKAQTISGKTPEEGDDINFDDIDIDVEAPSDVFIKTLKAKNKIKGFLNDLTPEQIKKLNKTAEDLFQEFNNTSVTIEEFIENLKNCYI
jgi:hypothetical protein